MNTWFLTIWLVLPNNGLDQIGRAEFATQSGCVAALTQLQARMDEKYGDTVSWIASCGQARRL